MAISQQSFTQVNQVSAVQSLSGDLLEKVILGNDLAGLSSIEKVQYVKNICQTIGLNPVTKPIQLMKFNGKETPYFTKDATEQLRKINRVSLSIKETKIVDDLYIVIVEATTPDGRTDSSTGAIVVSGLKGEAKANAFMKAETKAKRRATLSICGLGFIDECEVESIPNAKKIDVYVEEKKVEELPGDVEILFTELLADIKNSSTLEELKNAWNKVKMSYFVPGRHDLFQKLLDVKEERKKSMQLVKEFNEELDATTGEIKEIK